MLKIRVFLQDHLSSFRSILLSFLVFILIGAVLLCMPVSSNTMVPVDFLDALFTATSATCVTGLVVYDTAVQWSLFGRIVLLIMIQIGGLGVITAIIATMVVTGKRIGIMSRIAMQDTVSAHQTGGIIRFTKFFLHGTFIVEAIGAVCLSPVFIRDFGFVRGVGYAIFHSVSAFCNAGFDLMGIGHPYSSLTQYAASPLINLTVCALIIIGGIGFLSWSDLLNNKKNFKQYRLQTKVILVSTVFLLVIPFLYFFILEFQDIPLKQRFWYSFFQSVTPRTAGFNTFNYAEMSETGLLVTIILMLVGGAPGSSAGGMKVTTLSVILLSTNAYLHRNKDVNCFRRRIDPAVIHNAMTLFVVYILLLLLGTMVISRIERLPVIAVMFECASALGTVGLTTGITPTLSAASKIILILFMFFGRAGGLTFAYATIAAGKNNYRFPSEKVTVG